MQRHRRLIVHRQPVVNNFTTGRPLIKGNRMKVSGAWSPSRLFASGEQGAWYDPSDLTTMFQDRAGTTPVTADGQTVGLILDKSKGLVLGPEFSNIPYSGTPTGSWVITGTSVTRNGETTGTATTTISTNPATISKIHKVTITVTDFSGDQFIVRLNSSPMYATISSNGTHSFYLPAGTTGTVAVTFAPYAGTVGEATITNISVKELPGNHAVAPTDAARPLYKTDGTYHWLQFDGINNSLSTAAIDFSAGNKLSVFAGFNNKDNADIASFFGNGDWNSDGKFEVFVPFNSSGKLEFGWRGNNGYAWRELAASSINTPYVISGYFDGSASPLVNEVPVFRYNSVQIETTGTSGTDNTSNIANASLFIGARSGSSIYFTGNMHSIIIRGAISTTQEITDTEAWVNSKTGAY